MQVRNLKNGLITPVSIYPLLSPGNTKNLFPILLRVSRSLVWHILDEISAEQSIKDIFQISQFLELAFNLQKK